MFFKKARADIAELKKMVADQQLTIDDAHLQIKELTERMAIQESSERVLGSEEYISLMAMHRDVMQSVLASSRVSAGMNPHSSPWLKMHQEFSLDRPLNSFATVYK